jgi:hypothetical protein
MAEPEELLHQEVSAIQSAVSGDLPKEADPREQSEVLRTQATENHHPKFLAAYRQEAFLEVLAKFRAVSGDLPKVEGRRVQ